MKYNIIFTDHFSMKRSDNSFAKQKRKPHWFNMKMAAAIVMEHKRKIDNKKNGETIVIRICLDKDNQYFLIKIDKSEENKTKVIFMSALRLRSSKAMLPFKEVKLTNRYDYIISGIKEFMKISQNSLEELSKINETV